MADGYSTDQTIEIAERRGCRVVHQDRAFLDTENRITDYSGPRNQLLDLTTQPWTLSLDSDEQLSRELASEIASVCSSQTTADVFEIASRYTLDGTQIDCASSYPFLRQRLFRTNTMRPWTGAVDEEVRTEGTVERLAGHLIIPLPRLGMSIRKWTRYARLEAQAIVALPQDERAKRLAFFRSSIRWFLQRYRTSRRECAGRRIPLRYEIARFAYFTGRYFWARWISWRRPPMRAHAN